MIRLAIIRQRYNPFGGAERFVERALAGLAASGAEIDVTLITRQWSGEAATHKQLGCDPFYVGRTWRDEGFRRRACALVQSGDFDLVQSHERLACCDIYRAGDGLHRAWLNRRARLLGAGSRFWLQASPYHRATLAAEEAMFRGSRLRSVICISELVKREIQEYFGLDDSRLPVVYNGVDLGLFNVSARTRRAETRRQFGIPDEVPLFLFLGSGYERKGLAQALAALPAGAWLLVVGKDKDSRRYAQQAERLGIASRVCFAGPQKDVTRFYGAADAFVFPTVYEPFGNVILEALACGLPILTTPDCGGAELVRAGENGFVLPGDDPEPWREAMTLLMDGAAARRMGDEAARTAQAFDIPTMTARMVQLYADLMAG